MEPSERDSSDVVTLSRVSRKHRRNRTQQIAPITAIDEVQAVCTEVIDEKFFKSGSNRASATKLPPYAKNILKDENWVFSFESGVITPSSAP